MLSPNNIEEFNQNDENEVHLNYDIDQDSSTK